MNTLNYLREHKMIVTIFLVAGVLIGVKVGVSLNHAASKPNEDSAVPVKTSDEVAGVTVQAPKGGFNPDYVSCDIVIPGWAPEQIPVDGKLAFDAEKLQLVSSRVSGRIDAILVFEGTKIEKGQALAELYSPDYIAAENEYILAMKTVKTLSEAKDAELLSDAKATEQSAINKLHVLGAGDEDIDNISKKAPRKRT